MKHIVLVDIDTLMNHERINRARLADVRRQIREQGVIRQPIVVDEMSQVILDGHHRVQALRELGARRVPVAYVRYDDETVRVYLRRKSLLVKLIKRAVIDMARSNRLFPSKTTRHMIHDRPTMKAVRVEDLMH